MQYRVPGWAITMAKCEKRLAPHFTGIVTTYTVYERHSHWCACMWTACIGNPAHWYKVQGCRLANMHVHPVVLLCLQQVSHYRRSCQGVVLCWVGGVQQIFGHPLASKGGLEREGGGEREKGRVRADQLHRSCRSCTVHNGPIEVGSGRRINYIVPSGGFGLHTGT